MENRTYYLLKMKVGEHDSSQRNRKREAELICDLATAENGATLNVVVEHKVMASSLVSLGYRRWS